MVERWRCPRCHRDENLSVVVTTMMRLQQFDDDTFSTGEYDKFSGDHEWDNNSLMVCRDCEHSGKAEDFTVSPPSEVIPSKVFVVFIYHRHGHDIYLNASESGAFDQVYTYVEENWSDLGVEEPPPSDRCDAVREYFDGNDTEYYEITELSVSGIKPVNGWIIVSLQQEGAIADNRIYRDEETATAAADEVRNRGIDCYVKGLSL